MVISGRIKVSAEETGGAGGDWTIGLENVAEASSVVADFAATGWIFLFAIP
jgi:hypothetical protein